MQDDNRNDDARSKDLGRPRFNPRLGELDCQCGSARLFLKVRSMIRLLILQSKLPFYAGEVLALVNSGVSSQISLWDLYLAVRSLSKMKYPARHLMASDFSLIIIPFPYFSKRVMISIYLSRISIKWTSILLVKQNMISMRSDNHVSLTKKLYLTHVYPYHLL